MKVHFAGGFLGDGVEDVEDVIDALPFVEEQRHFEGLAADVSVLGRVDD